MPLDPLQRNWYALTFENRFLRETSKEFEDFFADLMGHRFPGDFEKVRPYGKTGDLKCDGRRASDSTVFQCYAPDEMKVAKVLAKMRVDFLGAVEHWGDLMRRWEFVHNDRRGLPAEVSRLLAQLRTDHPGVTLATCGYPELHRVAMDLELVPLEALFGPAPTLAAFAGIGFAELQPVLLGIRRAEPEVDPPLSPPPSDKIERNDLSAEAAALLQLGRRKESLVQDFFARWPDPTLGESIAEGFRNEYARLASSGASAERIFADLQQFAGGPGGEPPHQGAVLAVMSYFFERCDIFEGDDPEDAP